MERTTPGSLLRKAVHVVLSLVAAGVVYALDPIPAAIVLAAATLVALTVELARRWSGAAGRAFDRILGGMLKEGERAGVTGATTLSVGFTATAVLLPGGAALAGILFAGLADPAAGVAGRRWGRLRYPGGKSVAGSAACLVVAFGIGLGLGLGPGRAALAAALVTAVEAFALRVDDNVYLSLAGAAAVRVAGWLIGG